MLEYDSENLLTIQEMTDIINEHMNMHGGVIHHDVFLERVVDCVNKITENYAINEQSKPAFQRNVLDKILDNVNVFYAGIVPAGIAQYDYEKKIVVYDALIIKKTSLEFAKYLLKKDEFESVKRDVTYNNITSELSQKYQNIYLQNLNSSINHELLHASKVQNIYAKNEQYTFSGLYGLMSTHKQFNHTLLVSPYYSLDEAINSLHEVTLLDNGKIYKGSNKFTDKFESKNSGFPSRVFNIQNSYINLKKSNCFKQRAILENNLPFKSNIYFNAINIAELIEQLIGKSKLFQYIKDDVFGLYKEFNKYSASAEKYLDQIHYLLNEELSDLKSANSFGKNYLEDTEVPSTLFVLALLADKLMNGEKEEYFACQELAQSILLDCFSTKIKNMRLYNFVDYLEQSKEDVINLMKNVSGCVFIAETKSAEPYSCEIELDNFYAVCQNKLAEINKLILENSKSEQIQ